MVRDAKQPRQRTPVLTAAGRTPAVSPHEHLGRDVLGINDTNTPRHISQDTPTMTVVQLGKRGRRLHRPSNQLKIASCYAHILYVGIRVLKVRGSEHHKPSALVTTPTAADRAGARRTTNAGVESGGHDHLLLAISWSR